MRVRFGVKSMWMRMRRRIRTKIEVSAGTVPHAVLLALVLLSFMVTSLLGQASPQRLTLDEAIRLARDNNPTFRSVANDRAAADWQLREAVSAFLPTANASSSMTWQEGGAQRFGTVDLGVAGTDWYQSYYSLSATWQLSGNTIFGIPAARANQKATDARITAAEFNLESTVALQYMAVLRGQDGVDVAQRQLDRANQNLRIVRTRLASGAAAGTDGKQAEVDLGRAEVGVIQAQRQLREARALLAEQVGVPLDENVELEAETEVFEPTWDREGLISEALESHPSLRSFVATERAASAAAKQAASAYFPTITLSTSLQGTTQQATNEQYLINQAESSLQNSFNNCEFQNALLQGVPSLPGSPRDCSQYTFSDQMRQQILAENNVFPFNYTKLPLFVRFQVSIPIFTGFSRQRQVSQAYNQAEDAEFNRKAEELRLRTAVTQAFDNLRYALGATGLLELLDAQTALSTADQAYLNALYDFHWNLIRLEASVGRSLRPE